MKHAYLIVAHDNFEQLNTLLNLLDDERNDIYLHIDKKSAGFSPEMLSGALSRASLHLVRRGSITWGGYSQIRTTLLLLKQACKTAHSYYHLLSGVDLPLKTQSEIHSFFEHNPDREYIAVDNKLHRDEALAERVRYFYPFQDIIGRHHSPLYDFLRTLQGKLVALQMKLKISRIPAAAPYVYKGSNWFSISHEAALYLLSRQKEIRRRFRMSSCGDEFYLQTVFMLSPFAKKLADNNLRFIDWDRGMPYTFTGEDYELLMNSGMLFARKFSPEHPEIINMIVEQLKKG